MKYRLAVLTHGRSEPLEKTLASFKEHVFPPPSSARVYVDGAGGPSLVLDAFRNVYGYGEIPATDVSLGEPRHGIAPVRAAPFPLAISHPSTQRGFCGATAALWREAIDGPEEFVFWLEHDFVFLRDVDLRELASVLERYPTVAQVALVRNPVNEQEIAAGGLIESRPGEFETRLSRATYRLEEKTDVGFPELLDAAAPLWWLEHRSFFTTTPSLMRRSFMVENPWPGYQSECEGRFGIDLVARGFSFGYWGRGEPWVEHFGIRDGVGY